MSSTTLSEFFAMGGYGVYVWGSFGLSVFVFVANIIASRRLRQRVLFDISQMKDISPNSFSESRTSLASENSQKEKLHDS